MTKNPIVKLSELLLTLNPFEFATLAYILGVVLSEGLNSNQLQSLGNFYNLLGEVMQTIGAQAQNLNGQTNTPNIDDAIEVLKTKVNHIEDIIQKFKTL